MCYLSLDLMLKAKLKLESRNWKIQYGRQVAILEVTLLKIDRLLSIYTDNLRLKFILYIQIKAKLKLKVTKLKNPIWLPGGHFESDISEIKRFLSIYTSNVLLKFGLDIKVKLKLKSENWKIQYGRQVAILKVTSVKINRLWPMATSKMYMKFEIEIPNQTRVTLLKPCHLQSPANMAARRPFCKWHYWKSTGFFPYTHVMCQWSLNLIFKAKIKLESGNRKI